MKKIRLRAIISGLIAALLLSPTGAMGSEVVLAACGQSNNTYRLQTGLGTYSTYHYIGNVGGVSLDKAATFLADMSDVRGAYFDQESNRIVLVGPKLGAGQTPIFNKDDLAVAVRSVVFNNTVPQVNIGDPNNPGQNPWPVQFFGGLENTNFGNIIEKADYDLKKYYMGYHANGQSISTSVGGYSSVTDRFLSLNPSVSDGVGGGRLWISPQDITIKNDDTNGSFVFDQVSMQVQFQPVPGSSAKYIQANSSFAQHMTDNYDGFAQENIWWKRTKELSKIVSVVKWLKDSNIVTDYEWARDYKPAYVQTATGEPWYNVGPITQGNLQWTFSGGVLYDAPNTYNGDNGQSSALKAASENASPSEEADHWTFSENGQAYQSVAVSASAFRSVGTYTTQTTDFDVDTMGETDLSFTRTYNSLSTTSKEVGAGWEYVPARLTNLAPSIAISCSPQGGYSGYYPKRMSFVTESGNYETFTYNCGTGYAPDKPEYHSKLTRNSDGSYTVLLKDQSHYRFSIGTALLMKRDKNNNGIYYQYDNNAPYITRIQDDYDRNLVINRNAQGVITSVTDWTGRSVSYGYDGNGNLTSVTDARNNTVNYGYDTKNRLATVTDRQNRTILSNTYNDDNKITSSVDASNLTTNFTYDEDNRLVTVTDSNMRTVKTYYDDQTRVLKQVDPLNNYVEYTYGNEPAPLSVRDKNNRTTTFTYDANGNKTSVTYPNGKQVTQQFNSQNLVTQVSDERYGMTPRITSFTYDTEGNLLTKNDAGIVTEYGYDAPGNLTSEKDGRNNTTTRAHNSFGRKTTETNPLGAVTSYGYDNLGRLTQSTDPTNKVKSYTYDANNSVLTMADGAGTTSNLYDADNRLIKVTTPDNKVTELAYQKSGAQIQTKDPLQSLTNYGYDQYNKLISRQDALNHTTQFAYDELNRKKESTTPLGKVAKWEYDAKGNITKRIDESNRSTLYEYDSMDRLTKTTYPDTSTITYAYDDRNNLTQAVSPVGTSVFTYDIHDRLTSEKNPHNALVVYTYDNADNLTQTTYPDNKTVTYAYDEANRPTTVTDWNSKQTTYQYNSNGTVSKYRLPNNVVATYGYDTANRSNVLTYTLNNNLVSKFNYERDGRGNVTKETESKPTTATSYVIYDEALRTGWARNWSWDSTINNLDTASFYEGTKSLSWKPNAAWAGLHIRATSGSFDTTPYNAISFAMKASQPGQKAALGIKDLSDNELVDPIDISLYGGNLSSTGYKVYTIPLSAFNADDRQILGLNFVENSGGAQQKLYIDNLKFTTATPSPLAIYDDELVSDFSDWSWDAVNNFSDTTEPYSGSRAISSSFMSGYAGLSINHWQGVKTTGYSHLTFALKGSQANQTTSVQLTNQQGDGIGSEKLLSSYGGNPTNAGYTVYEVPLADLQGSNTVVYGVNIQNQTGSSPVALKVDEVKLLPVDASPIAASETTFTYDSAGNLLTANYPGRSYGYTYDMVGSRLSSNENGTQSTYTVNNDNQILSKGSRTFTYDNQGNRITDGSKSLTYDFDSKLKTWSDPSTSTTLSFVYDALNDRIEKNINGVKTFEYVNDNSGDLSRVLVGKNVINNNKTHYVYGLGAISQGGNAATSRQYYLSDGVGNVRYVTDSVGSSIQAYTYDPYGNEVTTGNLSNFTFQSQEKDREADLTYLRARYYDPSTGSFISRDPVAGTFSDPRSQHGYSYAHNDPINLSDPSGEAVPVFIMIGMAVYMLGAAMSAPDIYNGVNNCDYGQVAWGAVGFMPGMGSMGRLGKVAARIAGGHAKVKHFDEFSHLGIFNQQQFTQHIDNIMTSPSATRKLSNGRTAYIDSRTSTIVIHDPKHIDQGTAFIRKNNPWGYFNSLQ